MPVAVSEAVKSEVQRIAAEQRRSMSQQAAELLEIGLAEYERRIAAEQSVQDGKTQIDPAELRR